MAKKQTFRPEELAESLGVSGKQIRGFLRATFTRPASAKGSTWVLDAKQAKTVRDHFMSRRATTAKPVTRTKSLRDNDATRSQRVLKSQASGVKVTHSKPTVKAGTRATATAPLPDPSDSGMHATP